MFTKLRQFRLLIGALLLGLTLVSCQSAKPELKAPEAAPELLRFNDRDQNEHLAPHMAMPEALVTEQLELRKEQLSLQNENQPLVMAHYFPWYQTPEVHGYWGVHWRMNTCDPEQIDAEGKRDICSHYYPIIGPYDSLDPDLLEYHILLMKLSGIDGIIVDFYGAQNFYDWPVLREASDTILEAFNAAGLKVAIMYIDQTLQIAENNGLITDPAAAALADLAYIEEHYFALENYLQVDGEPLLLDYGPVYLQSATNWQSAYAGLASNPDLASLGYVDGFSSTTFPWIEWPEWQNYIPNYYAWVNWKGFDLAIGSAYFGFHDYYNEGGWGNSLYYLDDLDGERFGQYLAENALYNPDIIQLATWNGFVEGTMLEPTLETGYQYLQYLQDFTGVPYSVSDLELVTQIYKLRKAVGTGQNLQSSLSSIRFALEQGNTLQANKMMQSLKFSK